MDGNGVTAAGVAAAVGAAVGWLRVRIGPTDPGGLACEQLLHRQEAGEDPTSGWRERTRDGLGEPATAPAQVAGMFVLQWYTDVALLTQAVALATTGRGLALTPASTWFALGAGGFPDVVGVTSDEVVDPGPAAELAVRHAQRFADSYEPDMRIGARTRTDLRTDRIRAGLRLAADAGAPADRVAAAAAAFGVEATGARLTCCLIYALPGAHECADCPRLRTSASP